MVSITPQCFMCVWFRKVTQEQVEAEGTDELCLAYPHGIPGDVFIGNVVHDKVLPGQEGRVGVHADEKRSVGGGRRETPEGYVALMRPRESEREGSMDLGRRRVSK